MAARRILFAGSLCRSLRLRGAQRKKQLSSAAGDVKLFDKILVANRGEIACRVMGTAQRLGIRTVTVYSEADRNAMHVAVADEAYCIGPPPSNESYLRQEKILEVARSTGAQAIHPGYGFLSENKEFAELCQREGVEFIGPPPSAIEKMGLKRVSKEIMSKSSVPVVPGYFGEDQSDERLRDEAEKIGFPVMIKADRGGGGKGMRVVQKSSDFQSSMESCRFESKKSFGDDKLLVEKVIERPRHVEVQIFGDKHGNMLHLFERDCSVQRRHQKIIEEAPAPGLHPEVREMLWNTAVRAAQAVGYVGAGTVEFIMDLDQQFYFMEMNTRLQVEHPVTEMISGTDLVEWQIRVAAGARMPVDQSDLIVRGHAFEARIYAENPDMQFSPSPGMLHHLVTPKTSESVRIDTGVRQGDEVTTYYDPMIAKLVVWGEDRTSALKKLVDNLRHYQVAGVTTNVDFLGRLASHESFQDGDVHTGFIEQHNDQLFPKLQPLSDFRRLEGALALLALEEWQLAKSQANSNDPYSLFSRGSGTRLNLQGCKRTVHLKSQDESFDISVVYTDQGSYTIAYRDESEIKEACGRLSQEGGTLVLRGYIGDQQIDANIAVIGNTLHVFSGDSSYTVEIPKPSYIEAREKANTGGTRSPKYPTQVTKVHVKPGDEVEKGTVVMTVEGMKMETNILAVKDGRVKTVFFKEKDNVAKFSEVMELEEEMDEQRQAN